MRRHTLTRPGGVIIGQSYARLGELEVSRWIAHAVRIDAELPDDAPVELSACETYVHPAGDPETVLAFYDVVPVGAGHPIVSTAHTIAALGAG